MTHTRRTPHPGSVSGAGPARRTRYPVRYAPISIPIGRLFVAYRGKAVCCVTLGSSERNFERACVERFGVRPIRDPRLSGETRKLLLDHLTGRRRFAGRIDLSGLTPFQQRVLRKVRTIPAGEVRSYRWVAQAIGAERAARAVGTALARNPIPLLIPCHRVVTSDGRLGEYTGGGPLVKARLLALEGVSLENPRYPLSRRKVTIGR